jgi:acyl-CoA hydrolase
MDIAAGIVASHRAEGPVATVAIEAMEFIAPILLHDIISVYARIERTGRTSMGIRIEVVATRNRGTEEVKVTEALFTFVALDEKSLVVPCAQHSRVSGSRAARGRADVLAVEPAGHRLGVGVAEAGLVAIGERQPGEQVGAAPSGESSAT